MAEAHTSTHRRRGPRSHHPSAVAERVAREASEPRPPRLSRRFIGWAIGRVLALALLVGSGWVVYDLASSDRFVVRSVRVTGNLLLSQADVEQAAAALGANLFWVDRAEAEARLRRLPLVRNASVSAMLPGTVEIAVVEREPAAFWVSGEQVYLVDAEGVILKTVDGDPEHVRACAGQPCDPHAAPLPTVAQVDGQPLVPGEHVHAGVLRMSARLGEVLPTAGLQAVAFEWSRDTGLEVATNEGWRARFDEGGDLDRQLTSLQAVREQLARTRAPVGLIDVRFGDRPYYR